MSGTSLETWLTEVQNVAEGCGLKLSPAPFTVASTPSGLADKLFSVNLQSRNTGKYRDDDFLVRALHALTISVLVRIPPNNQFEGMLEAARIEARILDKVLPRGGLPDTVVTWSGTRRTLTRTREHFILDVAFDCEVDFPTGAGPQE